MEALTLLQQAFHHAAIDYRFPSQSVPDQAPSLIGGSHSKTSDLPLMLIKNKFIHLEYMIGTERLDVISKHQAGRAALYHV